MKTKKNNLIRTGERYSNNKWESEEILARKLSNIFWNDVDRFSCRINKLAELYEILIGREYLKESKIFKLSKKDNVLHIGCGAYPITALTLAGNNGVMVAGIDKNPRAVELARKIVRKKNLHNRITIENGDGINYPVEDFNTIIVSGCAMPKMKILKYVFEAAKPQSKIIVRELNTAVESVIECINSHRDITLVKKIKNQPFEPFDLFGWHSFYLLKK